LSVTFATVWLTGAATVWLTAAVWLAGAATAGVVLTADWLIMIATPPWFWARGEVGTAVTAGAGAGVTAGWDWVHPATRIAEKATSKTRNSVEFFIKNHLYHIKNLCGMENSFRF
jgi:hypothetical protein